MTEYRSMIDADIRAGLILCRAAGWNQLERDWQAFLQLRPGGSCVATQSGAVVGTVTTIDFQGIVGWIGMVLVDARCQRQGIGKHLLEEALQRLSGIETVKLDATAAGREVYLKLGFQDEYGLSRMIGHELPAVPLSPLVASLEKNDLKAIAAFDENAFGVNRQPLLEWMYNGHSSAAFVVKKNDVVEGYCLCRKGFNFFQVGPVIAQDIETAKILVSSAVGQSDGKPVVLDIPLHNPEWMNWLIANGFRKQREFVRMFRGTDNYSGCISNQFAIAGPEFG